MWKTPSSGRKQEVKEGKTGSGSGRKTSKLDMEGKRGSSACAWGCQPLKAVEGKPEANRKENRKQTSGKHEIVAWEGCGGYKLFTEFPLLGCFPYS